MITTGWGGGEEPDMAPAMPITSLMLNIRQGPDDVLGTSLARARGAEAREERDAAASATDPDEVAAGLIARGYVPGSMSRLSQQLGDVCAELADEQQKLERGARRAEQVMRAHQAGQVRALDIPHLLDDVGDEARVRQLQRQEARLRQQIGEAAVAISPPRPPQLDGVEASAQRANEVFRELTRARLAEMETRQVSRPARRPKGHGGLAVRSEVTCEHCLKYGFTPNESFLYHNDPQPAKTPAVPSEAEADWWAEHQAEASAERRSPRRDDYGMAVR